MTDPAATLATPTVHVVDDDPQVAKALARLLREHGFRSAVFDSAEAFLAQCDVSAPGCLVLDVNLPGLDGLALQRRLAKGGPAWPIVFMTGHGDIPMSVQAVKAGAVDFLTKPVARRGARSARWRGPPWGGRVVPAMAVPATVPTRIGPLVFTLT